MDDKVLEKLAREILMVDENGTSLVSKYEKIIKDGLPGPLNGEDGKKDVLIIGAGIAGLVSGRLLKQAGHNVTIIEANDDRIGGRVKTLTPDLGGSTPFKDPLLYAEAGAMRIPKVHPLVNKYIEILDLSDKVQSFYNVDVAKGKKPEAKTFRTWLKTNGISVRRLDNSKDSHPGRSLGFDIPTKYDGKTANELVNDAFKEPKDSVDETLPIDERIEGWKKIISLYGDLNMRQYLMDIAGYPDVVLDYIGTLENLTSRMSYSFIQSFIESTYINTEESYIELSGGNWILPYAFLDGLSENIVMDARAIEIEWSGPGETPSQGSKAVHKGRAGVYVKTINEPPVKRGVMRANRTPMEREFTADYLIVTIPFSALRFVTVSPMFSYHKRRAIAELHYDSATKVLLEFSQRFWEWDEKEWSDKLGDEYRGHDSIGGGSITDSPNRFMYFPSHQIENCSGGVVLASYSWADDARKWESIPDQDRYGFALKGLTDIYGPGIKRYFTGIGQTESWMQNFYAFGEAAIFLPGQLRRLHPHILEPEGKVHFAGEHASLKHAWIEGAIESAVRASIEVHDK